MAGRHRILIGLLFLGAWVTPRAIAASPPGLATAGEIAPVDPGGLGPSTPPTEGLRKEPGGFMASSTRIAAAMAVVIGLLWVLRLGLQRLANLPGRPSAGGTLEILARYPVARRQHLLLLRVVERILLVHQGESSMTVLCELTDPSERAAVMAGLERGGGRRCDPRATSVRFEAVARRAMRRAAGPGLGEIIDLTRDEAPREGVGA